jgi:lysophospholipase L1-like esterase
VGLNAGQLHYSHFGVQGKTASDAKRDPGQFLQNVHSNTDLVVLSFGSNDSGVQAGGKYRKDYQDLVDMIRHKAPNASVLMVGPTDGDFWRTNNHLPGLDSVTRQQESVQAQTLNSAYLNVRALPNSPFSSVETMRAKHLMQDDNLHLTPTGYRLLGSTIADYAVKNLSI